MSRLEDRIVLVTGAAGAVGSAVVEAVRYAGVVAFSSDRAGRPGVDLVLDVTAPENWQRSVGDLERRYGRLDGLVNAAGIAVLGNVEETEFATWRQVLAVN